MSFRDRWNRRTFLGALTALFSAMVGKGTLFASTASATPTTDPKPSVKGFGATGEVYKELGVITVINGEGTMTIVKAVNGKYEAVDTVTTERGARTIAVDEKTLPSNVRPTHRSLFDGTLQGIELTDRPAFSFQGHPEASPGPHEMAYLFDRFVRLMEKRKA